MRKNLQNLFLAILIILAFLECLAIVESARRYVCSLESEYSIPYYCGVRDEVEPMYMRVSA